MTASRPDGGPVDASSEAELEQLHGRMLRCFAVVGMALCLVVVASDNGDLHPPWRPAAYRTVAAPAAIAQAPAKAKAARLPASHATAAAPARAAPAAPASPAQAVAGLQWPPFGWNTLGDSAVIQKACEPFDRMLKAGFHPDNKRAPVTGIPIGYVKNPGKVWFAQASFLSLSLSLLSLRAGGGLLGALLRRPPTPTPPHADGTAGFGDLSAARGGRTGSATGSRPCSGLQRSRWQPGAACRCL